MEKAPHPAASGAHRAGDGSIPGQECRIPNSTLDPKILADALLRGAMLGIGRKGEGLLTIDAVQTAIGAASRLDRELSPDHLIGPAALCIHWFDFTGRQANLNRKYPVSRLHALIAACFGLLGRDLPVDAVFAGLNASCLIVERIKKDWRSPSSWAAAIHGRTHLPHDRRRWVPLTALGQRGALPPIKIEFWEGPK
jgi:hypothetical protein